MKERKYFVCGGFRHIAHHYRNVREEGPVKQEEEEEEIVVEALLDSEATGLVMSEEFARKYRFRRTKLERLIFKEHKERISIDVIGGQK